MINHVRNTVLSVLNKENRGFLTPAQFNSYAKHAQQLIFNQYLSEYSRMLLAKNARQTSSEFLDRSEVMQRKLEDFTKESSVAISANKYTKPTDLQYLVAVRYGTLEVEQVSRDKERFLLNSNLTAPSANFPIFVDEPLAITLYPSTLTSNVNFIYLRNPKDPKWTYNTIGENPVFNQSASDYQDFEIDGTETVPLVVEILKLAGVTIREGEVPQAAQNIDVTNTNKDS